MVISVGIFVSWFFYFWVFRFRVLEFRMFWLIGVVFVNF